MHINLTTAAFPGLNLNAQVSTDLSLSALAESDSITARVIFSAGGVVHLKTAEGELIRARLEGGAVLPEGSEVTLTVEEKSESSVLLRISSVQTPDGGSAAATTATSRQPDLPPALLKVFSQLQAADLPLTQKLELFAKALADFPGLSMQDAAVQEAIALIVAQAAVGAAQSSAQTPNGVGQLLAELAALLTPDGQGQSVPTAPAAAAMAASSAEALTSAGAPSASTAAAASAATATVATAAMTASSAEALTSANAPSATTVTTAAMTASSAEALTSATAPNASAAATVMATTNADAPSATTVTTATVAASSAEALTSAATAAATATVTASPVATLTSADAPSASTAATATAQAPPLSPEQRQQLTDFARQIVAELFMPGQSEPSPQRLTTFIQRLFALMGGTARQDGGELHRSARELETRLDFLKEALRVSSLPQREELLGQTSRILQQTEALRESRLLCMQIPIQFDDKRQTAELYVYRRESERGRKLDPHNATILLALNTEHLGRLEALIQTRGKEINLKLEIARAEAVPFVREQSAALQRLLAEAGFKLNSSSVSPLKRETNNPQAAEQALADFRRSFGGRLDFFI